MINQALQNIAVLIGMFCLIQRSPVQDLVHGYYILVVLVLVFNLKLNV